MNSACKEEENRKLSLACRLPIIIFAEDKLRPGKVRINSALRPARLSSQRRRYKKILHNIISKDFLPVLSTEKRYTDMDYVELNVRVTDPELAEILTAELAELPYESFQTEGEVLKAYIPRERLADCMQQTDDLLARYGIADRRYIAIESQNWNALWEQNFTPVDVDGRILIRAPFHAPQQGYELEVVVMPRMAFGSGHHATTCLVASALCDLPLEGKRGLDMGCGTGVLAIVAAKRAMPSISTSGPRPTAAKTRRRMGWRSGSSRCWATQAASRAGNTISSRPTSTAISSRWTCRPMPRRSIRAVIC